MRTEGRPIRVLLVDDSPLCLTLHERMLVQDPEIEVVGMVADGREALTAIQRLDPDVVCTDLHMPNLNGLELTVEVMRTNPRPILVVSLSVQEDDPENVFRLLEAGAVDVFPKLKGAGSDAFRKQAPQFIAAVKAVAGVVTIRRKAQPGQQPPKAVIRPTTSPDLSRIEWLGIGASTGGPLALKEILLRVPSNVPYPILCVQHIGAEFLEGLVTWLGQFCAPEVKIAVAGEVPKNGTVYFPPPSRQLTVDERGRFATPFPGSSIECPSVDVLFTSLARVGEKRTAGILLTGMGRDGANGLKAIADAGGVTIAQDEETSVIFGMPKAAVELGAVQHVLPLNQIAGSLQSLMCAS